MKNHIKGMKANNRGVLEEELSNLSSYERLKYEIVRLPEKEVWHVYSGGEPEWIYEIVEKKVEIEKRDIVCPECGNMLEDIEYSKHLFCPVCVIEWRV